MRLHNVQARQGLLWVRGAFQVLVKQPLGYAALFAACFFVMMLVGLIPILGYMMFATMPVASLLFMIATRRALDDLPVVPGAFVELKSAGRSRLFALAKLGLACGAAVLAIDWVGDVVDGGAFAALQQYAGSADEVAKHLADPALQAGVLARFCLAALLAIPAWHAPGLVYWGGLSWGRALFFSTYACWRNKGAFIVYAFAWMFVWFVMVLVIGVLVGVFQSSLIAGVILPLALAFWTAVGASMYFTFADCFEPDNAGVPLSPA